jgi:hypothetical protein
MVEKPWPRPLPTGVCWCNCGAEVPSRSFFVSGHDRVAESRVIRREYGSVPDFLAAHGYQPGSVKAGAEEPKQDA